MGKQFVLFVLLLEAIFSFGQNQLVPSSIVKSLQSSAKICLEKIPTEEDLKFSVVSSTDYTIITNLRSLCENIITETSMTIPQLKTFDMLLQNALNPSDSVMLKIQDNINKNKNISISFGGDGQSAPINCNDDYNECMDTSLDTIGPSGSSLYMCTVGKAMCELAGNFRVISIPINPSLKVQALKVEATIEKIYCRSAYDGKNDKTVEVYGSIDVLIGQMCYDGDTERQAPWEVSGTGYWKLEPENYIKMKKGQTINIDKKVSWKYSLPPTCGIIEGQTVIICRSNLEERDLPHNADDKLEDGCPYCKENHYCYNQVYLNQVIDQGFKTFNFVQIHSSGKTVLEVYFKVVVSDVSPIKGGGTIDTEGNLIR